MAVKNYRVLAVMVQFQPDTDTRTNGNGQFGGLTYLNNRTDIIDPLPHDRAYFERKLTFLKNYYQTASDSQVVIAYDVPSAVYTLPKKMSDYAPDRNSTDNRRLAEMLQDVWQTVDAQSPEIDFSQYQAFTVFHAGVGRDVNLVASTGVDLQPLDLPSLYFSLTSLKTYFGSTFEGFAVDNGAVKIQTSAIIPETESRELDAIGGKVLLELSINGLIAASFGSYLGLPDLFNTQTGASGIGRFGLADGEGIFNYNGILPPEPSAWERTYLGWTVATEVSSIDAALSLPAVGLHQKASPVIYKVPISSKEYFLIENRNRNAKGTGVTLTTFLNGATSTRTFTKDEDNFSFTSTSGLDGDIIQSDNYDWTIPAGSVNEKTLDGGILIWHIDETIIEANLASNTVNTGKPRGVFLLEADGIQDIGQSYDIQNAGNGTQAGTPLDFFSADNVIALYGTASGTLKLFPRTQLIDGTTFPNTRSNANAETKLVFKQFSTIAPTMSVRITRGDDVVKVINGFPVNLATSFDIRAGITAFKTGISYRLLANTSTDSVRSILTDGTALISESLANRAQAKVTSTASANFLVKDSSITLVQTVSPFNTFTTNVGSRITTTTGVDANNGRVVVGTAIGNSISLTSDSLKAFPPLPRSQNKIVTLVDGLAVAEDGNNLNLNLAGRTITAAVGGFSESNGLPKRRLSYAFLTKEKDLIILYQTGETKIVPVPCVNEIKSSPAIADLEHRGEPAIIITADDKIFAYNEEGNLITNFPIAVNSALPINASPIVADVDGDTFEDIIVQTQDGRLMAFDRNRKNLFTLAIAQGTETTPTVVPSLGGTGLYLFSVDKAGLLQGFELPRASQNIAWGSLYADNLNSNAYKPQKTANNVPVVINELMPEQRVYNWPNPAKSQTNFRFYLKESAGITIKVFELTGRKVWETSLQGTGGIDNEVAWNLASVQSGVYYAVVTAQGSSTATVKLKVAVVK